jgi:hypothetical protein
MADQFLDWYRSSLFGLASDPPMGGRLQATLPLTLRDTDSGATAGGATKFELLGPGDVTGLDPLAITLRYPRPGASDAEATKAAHVEFAEPDLPWRYTPAAITTDLTAMGQLPPWLVLVTGTPDEVIVDRRGRVELRGDVLKWHPLEKSHQWAHLHDKADGRVARLLSPRDLAMPPGQTPPVGPQDYVAALVPAYRIIGEGAGAQLVHAWQPSDTTVVLPCFDSWRFTTAGGGDFAQISLRLHPIEATRLADFGAAHVRLRAADPRPGAEIRGALALIKDQPGDADPLDASITEWMGALTAPVSGPPGRWILSLPNYTAAWPSSGVGPPPAGGWRAELATDPRRRLAAGLGAWAAIEWQERIAAAAAAQAGALALASAKIRHMTAGLAAMRSLWRRRVPSASAPIDRLVLFAPMLARLPAAGRTVLDQIAGRTPNLVPELFSTAARRVLRRGTARSTYAEPGATDLSAVFSAAATCPPPPPRDKLDGPVQSGRVDPASFAGAAQKVGLKGDADGQALFGLFATRDSESDTCLPVDMAALGAAVAAAIDPIGKRPLVVDRVLGTITGLPEPLLAPPDFSPELDLPLWAFLNDRAKDWLLPGIGALEKDEVVAVQSNPVFVDAFLLGANVQALGELRWRNIPVTTAWTPLRRFWNHNASAPDGGMDIRPVNGLNPLDAWTDGSRLGDNAHAAVSIPPNGGRNQLVVVFRTELFRRYPATLVYLAPAIVSAGAVDWGPVPEVDKVTSPDGRIEPVLTGMIGPDVTFFGFPVSPGAAADHWVVVEEPPPGIHFRTDPPVPTSSDPASTWAANTFAVPVRVFLGKLLG